MKIWHHYRMYVAGALILCAVALWGTGLDSPAGAGEPVTAVRDQLGRWVTLPQPLERIATLHHFGGRIVFALGQEDKLVQQGLYGRDAAAMAAVDPVFAALPSPTEGNDLSVEELVVLGAQLVFVYASFERSAIDALERVGISVIALKGETMQESFEAVRLVGEVLDCQEQAESYIEDCRDLLDLVQARVADIPPERRPRVLFSGPKSVYTAATGEMLQNEILELAGGRNVAEHLKGFWCDVSPEQVALWNPDVIFLGSSWNRYQKGEVFDNSQFGMVKAVREGEVHAFPSNIGWWDFPAPHCVLGVVWSAKTLYPERFRDVKLTAIADGFYTRHLGHSFSALGGRLEQE